MPHPLLFLDNSIAQNEAVFIVGMVFRFEIFRRLWYTDLSMMKRESIIMDNVYELANAEIHEYCALNVETGEKSFSKEKSNPCVTGLYFKNGTTFLGLYRSPSGPKIYYDGKEYPVCKDLSISLAKVGKHRRFCIREYGIAIEYEESPYIGMDVWSEEIDVDLFSMITQKYQSDDFYMQYTINADNSASG